MYMYTDALYVNVLYDMSLCRGLWILVGVMYRVIWGPCYEKEL